MQWIKLSLLTLLGLILAFLAFVQAASLIANNRIAGGALFVFGHAELVEDVAAGQLQAAVLQGTEIHGAAREALPAARQAFVLGPLVPRALTIMALAEEDPVASTIIVKQSLRISRRELMLQATALETFARQNDFNGVVEVFSNIVRVHPGQKTILFPQLAVALQDTRSLPAFVRILKDKPEWAEDFLTFAAREASPIDNLIDLRQHIADDEEYLTQVDRQILSRLFEGGRVAEAAGVYQRLTGKYIVSAPGPIDWRSDLPPFDWALSEDPYLRAETTAESADLYLYIRDGNGGLLAERLVNLPAGSFQIATTHDLKNIGENRSLRLKAHCLGREKLLFDKLLVSGTPIAFRTDTDDKPCRDVVLSLYGRSFLGYGDMSVHVSDMVIKSDNDI